MARHEANIDLLWSELARLSETGELRRLFDFAPDVVRCLDLVAPLPVRPTIIVRNQPPL